MYQGIHLPFNDYVTRARAPSEHLFNYNSWYDGALFWSKQLEDKELQLMDHVRRAREKKLDPPPSWLRMACHSKKRAKVPTEGMIQS